MMDREAISNAFKNTFQSMTLKDFASEFITPIKAIQSYLLLQNGVDDGGSRFISLLFNPHRLDVKIAGVEKSLLEGMKEEKTFKGFCRLYLCNLNTCPKDAFKNTLRRSFDRIQLANEFPPYVVRSVLLTYAGGGGITMLDPCCGWGGRMIGCASLPNSRYVGCEPSTKTYEGLVKLGEWLKEKNPTFDFEIHHKPYEEFQTDEKFDIALTSPPYYDTEKYSDEETNSLNKFKTFDEWVVGFYRPLILNTMERLKDEGCFILNVGDRRYPLSKIAKDVCDEKGFEFERVNDYLAGNGENKEKFYCISKKPVIQKQQELFLELD